MPIRVREKCQKQIEPAACIVYEYIISHFVKNNVRLLADRSVSIDYTVKLSDFDAASDMLDLMKNSEVTLAENLISIRKIVRRSHLALDLGELAKSKAQFLLRGRLYSARDASSTGRRPS